MLETINDDLKVTVSNVVDEIYKTQVKIFQEANVNVLELYFYIGKAIDDKMKWGNKFIDELSIELKMKFPNAKGYSPRNLRNMRKYYLSVKDNENLKKLSVKIPWSHNTIIMDRLKSEKQKIWYIEQTFKNGWSYDYLEIQIKRDSYSRHDFIFNRSFA